MWVGVVGSWGRGRHVSGVRVRSTEEEPRVAVSHGSGARGAPRETGLSVAGSRKVCVRVCGGGGGVGGMASARRPRSRECSRRFSPSRPGSVTRQTLAVKQPTTWLSVVRVGVRVETRRFGLSHAPSLAHLAPYCQPKSVFVRQLSRWSTPQPSHRCASTSRPFS